MNRRLLTGLDVTIITIIIVVAIAFIFVFFTFDNGNVAVISVNEQIVGEYSLNTDLTKEIKTIYGSNTVVISSGECFVVNADCRDCICVNRGKISKIGESIVCLPHKMIVEIK